MTGWGREYEHQVSTFSGVNGVVIGKRRADGQIQRYRRAIQVIKVGLLRVPLFDQPKNMTDNIPADLATDRRERLCFGRTARKEQRLQFFGEHLMFERLR